MIAVEMREEYEIERRQIGQLNSGIGQAGGVQPAAEPGLLVLVDERRVGQDREAGNSQQDRRVADEKDRALIRRGGNRILRERESGGSSYHPPPFADGNA